jgi:flagellar basal-body rod protein FlgF
MDPISFTVASGMRARMESLDLLANNVANAETGGYKVDREFYNLYLSSDASAADNAAPELPVIERNYTDFSQGTLRETGNSLDFALDGPGFFTVSTPAGTAYTRNGSFRLASSGELTSAEGLPVLDRSGKPIRLDPSLAVEASSSGELRQGGQPVAQLAVVSFAEPASLQKQGNTLYRPANPATAPTVSSAGVRQGQVENSNLNAPESAVRLVSVMRQFEMLQRAMHIGAEMNRKAVEEVAKVNS